MTASYKPEIKEGSLIYQSDLIHYEQAYSLNNFEFLDSTELTNIIGAVLNEILKKTDRLPSTLSSVFTMKNLPRITISSYLSRLLEKFKCPQECLIAAMIYIDRLTVSKPKFVIKSTNIHKLMFVALMSAAKFLDDNSYKNEHYARAGGLTVKEVNELETELLQSIGYDLYVNPILFFRYREQLLSQGRPLL